MDPTMDPTMDRVPDLRTWWLTYPQAANLAGVKESVIRNWASRGYRATSGEWTTLPVDCVGDDGRRRVLAIHVLQAEAATRQRARRSPIPAGRCHAI